MALIEGLRLDGPMVIGDVEAFPLHDELAFSGRELRGVVNRLLHERQFVTQIEPWSWGPQFAPNLRLCWLLLPPRTVDDVVTASVRAPAIVNHVIDSLALTYGGAPRVVAIVLEKSEDGETWARWSSFYGGGTQPGSVLERLKPDNENLSSLDPLRVFEAVSQDPRLGLWLSLYRGALSERRWDVRVLRFCSLLETIGNETVGRKTAVIDGGGALLIGHDGKPATTKSLRGLIYMLVASAIRSIAPSDRILLTSHAPTLWQEVGIWADVRNMVAHEGMWRPPPLRTEKPGPQRRSAAAFEIAGRGDGIDSGAGRYVDAVAAGAEAVLRAFALSAV